MVEEKIDVFATPEKPVRDLTPEEVARFARERIIHVSGVLSAVWIKRIEDVVDAQIQATGLQSMKSNAWHTDGGMHRIIMNCPVAHLAQQVLDGLSPASDPEPRGRLKPVRFFYDQMFVKHPLTDPADDAGEDGAKAREDLQDAQGHPGNTPWHHDITFWPVDGEQIVSIWIALDQGNLSAISFDLQAGDVLIFDANILHGAPPNLSARPRRGLSLRYLGSDVVFDNNKYGEQTSMAPFDCYDESLLNGDRVAGFVYPQVLPDKIPAEVERRLSGPIAPNKVKMERWLQRNKAASEAAAAQQ